MKKIKIGNSGLFALVDDEDFDHLNQFGWYKMKGKRTFYAARDVWKNNKRIKRILMHREIMGFPADMLVDHIDHDGLNNQRENLRICTYKENARNSTSMRGSTSKYLGVCAEKTKKGVLHWRATITVNRKSIWLGSFKTEWEASLAYDDAAVEYFGEFANLNWKEITECIY